jgi:DNA-binding NarL/FixJ family response regulator
MTQGGTSGVASVPERDRSPEQTSERRAEKNGQAPKRVLIADDQTLFRTGLARLIGDDPRLEVVGQAADGQEAIEMVDELKPDLVLMDLKMPNVDGIEATRRIVGKHPNVKVLILTTFDTDPYVLQAMRAGASGYVLKDSSVNAIVASSVTVLEGEQVMATAVTERVLALVSGTKSSKEVYDGLTAREIEILKLLASGMANKQVAYRLRISEKTVRNHVSNMYEKLNVSDRSQAVLYAIRKGLIEL